MRAHLIVASVASAALVLLAAAAAGCAHDTARDVHTTSAPVPVTAPPAPPPPATPTNPAESAREYEHDHGAAPLEDDVGAPGLGSTTRPGGQYGNGTSGTSSDTHKGTWRGTEQRLDPKPRPPSPMP